VREPGASQAAAAGAAAGAAAPAAAVTYYMYMLRDFITERCKT